METAKPSTANIPPPTIPPIPIERASFKDILFPIHNYSIISTKTFFLGDELDSTDFSSPEDILIMLPR